MTTMQLTNKPQGQEFQADVMEQARAGNSMLAGLNVNFAFRNHGVDLATGRHGLKWLIVKIMREAGAVCNSNGQPECMVTSSYVAHKVEQYIGPDRYIAQSVRQLLSAKDKMQKDGLIGKMQLPNEKDVKRTCKRPRMGFWLLATEAE